MRTLRSAAKQLSLEWYEWYLVLAVSLAFATVVAFGGIL